MQSTLVAGEGVGGDFVAAAEETLADALGFRPFHGTLNLDSASVEMFEERTLDEIGDGYCDGVRIRDCRIAGVRAAIIRPIVPDYPPQKTEVVAPVRLRSLFDIATGDTVPLSHANNVWPPASLPASSTALGLFDAAVFDLDGTLVDLTVDWEDVRTEIISTFGDCFDKPLGDYDIPDLFATAREHGVNDELEAVLSSHELEGASRATSRPLLAGLDELSCSIGVCTVNSPEAAERALQTLGVRDAVDCIVGRGTVPEYKPKPEPLLACLQELDTRPGNAVFVGDLWRDAETAKRASTSFLSADQVSITGKSDDSTESSQDS